MLFRCHLTSDGHKIISDRRFIQVTMFLTPLRHECLGPPP